MICEEITMTDEWNERIDRLKAGLEKYNDGKNNKNQNDKKNGTSKTKNTRKEV